MCSSCCRYVRARNSRCQVEVARKRDVCTLFFTSSSIKILSQLSSSFTCLIQITIAAYENDLFRKKKISSTLKRGQSQAEDDSTCKVTFCPDRRPVTLDLDKSSGRQKFPAWASAAYPLIKANSAKLVGFWEVEMSTPAIGQSQLQVLVWLKIWPTSPPRMSCFQGDVTTAQREQCSIGRRVWITIWKTERYEWIIIIMSWRMFETHRRILLHLDH
jgi:hypothetical protein